MRVRVCARAIVRLGVSRSIARTYACPRMLARMHAHACTHAYACLHAHAWRKVPAGRGGASGRPHVINGVALEVPLLVAWQLLPAGRVPVYKGARTHGRRSPRRASTRRDAEDALTLWLRDSTAARAVQWGSAPYRLTQLCPHAHTHRTSIHPSSLPFSPRAPCARRACPRQLGSEPRRNVTAGNPRNPGVIQNRLPKSPSAAYGRSAWYKESCLNQTELFLLLNQAFFLRETDQSPKSDA